ncbi:DUF1329 domain-containing protein [Stenotrophobium rhamnosiphilum]|nr:DUF1329 domain-containing protein [Stenotrophobium rhamnosiphilum]
MNLKCNGRWMVGVVAACFALTAVAKTTPEKAVRLGVDLTPTGAQASANENGSIPPWTGGQTAVPANFAGAGARYVDPYPEDKPLFTITAANLAEYRARLTAGQIALFAKYPDTYKINVYPSRRSFANPPAVYEATRNNALSAELTNKGETLSGAITGIPFPIPENGQEAIWNHRLRYRDLSTRRWDNQFTVSSAGEYNAVKMRVDTLFNYGQQGIKPDALDNILFYSTQLVTEPKALAGTLLLIHETMDGAKELRKAWEYGPTQIRTVMRRSSLVTYDNFGTAVDGLSTIDQSDMFNGPLDRYDWKLENKREIYVPVNSYKVHSDQYKYPDIIRKNHVNQDLTRYELRRVWVVDARVKKGGVSHLYKRRTFYLDEDSWQIVLVDVYDAQDQLWRVQEGHSIVAYDKAYQMPVMETIYDLFNGRYLVRGLNNEEVETTGQSFEVRDFEPARARRASRK